MENINTAEIKQNVINKFDHVLENGDWESSLFFKTIGKRLQELRAEAVAVFGMTEKQGHEAQVSTDSISVADDETLVYISLYQADGKNMQKWQTAIKALKGSNICRPTYPEKAHLEEMIRHKADPQKEAYVIARVKKEDLLPSPEKGLQDRFGHALVTLREGVLTVENMVEFVHEGTHYRLDEGIISRVL